MGLSLYPVEEEGSSPTVTAFKMPAHLEWEDLDRRLREQGVGLGGSLGPLAGKVFRVGHMGVQANRSLVDQGMDVLARILEQG